MMTILFYIECLLLTYLGWAAIYQFVFSLAGRIATFASRGKENVHEGINAPDNRIVVMLPAYREDAVILHSAKEALKQHYPSHLFDVVVIADKLQDSTIEQLSKLPIQLVKVVFEKSTKSKAINAALTELKGRYDIAVVLDADNLMAPGFLNRISNDYSKGHLAIQGCREARELDTPMSILDAASESINNHILCTGHRALGLSARLAGSGMAFDYNLFRKVMSQVDTIGGFDKEMELRITEMGISIHYDSAAVVYDEKVSVASTFTHQRSRWLAAQYNYCKIYLWSGFINFLRRGNFDHFNKASQMALPPRLILPGVLFLAAVANLLTGQSIGWVWTIAFLLNVSSFLIAMPAYCYKKENLKGMLHLPFAFLSTIFALLKMKEARKRFIHTPHQLAKV